MPRRFVIAIVTQGSSVSRCAWWGFSASLRPKDLISSRTSVCGSRTLGPFLHREGVQVFFTGRLASRHGVQRTWPVRFFLHQHGTPSCEGFYRWGDTQAAQARSWLAPFWATWPVRGTWYSCRLRMSPLQWHLRVFSALLPVVTTPWCPSRRCCPPLTVVGRGAEPSGGVRFFRHLPPEVTLTTDASLLEFEAVARALFQFVHLVRGRKVLVRSDSTTVVAYINRQGGTHSFSLLGQAWDLFLWTSQQEITLQAIHLPGIYNTRADALSRQWQQAFEWNLNPAIFAQVATRCGIHPQVVLFASPTNNQTTMFCSQYPLYRGWHVNALAFRWRGHVPTFFPRRCCSLGCCSR